MYRLPIAGGKKWILPMQARRRVAVGLQMRKEGYFFNFWFNGEELIAHAYVISVEQGSRSTSANKGLSNVVQCGLTVSEQAINIMYVPCLENVNLSVSFE